MNIRTEISIDLDSNRKLWLTSLATDVDVEEVEAVADGMSNSLVKNATEAYETVYPHVNPEPGPRSLKRELQTFGDDDE